eukprot:364385-Chlamydomonas_euryale.AAC.7
MATPQVLSSPPALLFSRAEAELFTAYIYYEHVTERGKIYRVTTADTTHRRWGGHSHHDCCGQAPPCVPHPSAHASEYQSGQPCTHDTIFGHAFPSHLILPFQ